MKLPIHGQGVIVSDSQLNFFIYNADETDGLCVNGDKVSRLSTNETFEAGKNFHWISLDSQNRQIYVGAGEPRMETYTNKYIGFDKTFLESLTHVIPTPDRIIKDPITKTIPLIVKTRCTMHEMARNKYMPRANLSNIGQKLLDCIADAKLNDDDFPNFGKAIEHSIVTPGCWCFETLKKKASEFGKPNPDETYLRITLGQNNGESPGIPYVMEIWPPGHYSPIHSHAGANAIIRVLRGSVNVSLYAHLGSERPFASETISKGQVTWISPTLNQTHQLRNKGTKTCVTLQCYMYDDGDHDHYDYFDYLDDTGAVKQYEPDSDMEFVTFRSLMNQEWQKVSWFK
jgi:hypothetical protein